MTDNRAFSESGIRTKKDDYHGSCQYARTSPDIEQRGIKSVNVDITYEQALQLSLSIQSAVSSLNRYNRSTKVGRSMGLCLSIKTEPSSLSVIEAPVRTKAS